jgi:radical SAM superfamily enzyme YgiQ (UPF0313 family)
MKILLANPYCLDQRVQDYDIRIVPIGLYYIGAVLVENGHDVKIHNWHDAAGRLEMVADVIARERPGIVGISIMHASRWGGIDIARVVRKVAPECRVVFGGPGATFLWEHLLRHFPEIDCIVMGEGELTFLDIARAAFSENSAEGFRKALCGIPGIAFRKDGKPFMNEEREFVSDLDTLPDPARYFTFEHLVSSRGCPWNCTFCGSPMFWKRRVRFHSADYFVSQMERLYNRGVRFFYVSDDTFTVREERVEEICREIIRRGLDITWYAISRVNCITENILYWMRRAGCVQISFGVESGSATIRKLFNKQIEDAEIIRAFHLSASYGIMPRAYFIYGAPGESRKTVQKTLKLVERIKPLSAIFYILDLFPGTAMYDMYVRKKGVKDDIWLRRVEDIMYFEMDRRLKSRDVLKFGKKLRSGFYKGLSDFATSLSLVDIPELYPFHADFLARLGMTFLTGDYAAIPDIRDPDRTAEVLLKKALDYAPCERAFLGLGILMQKRGDYTGSAEILMQGRKNFSSSPDIDICLGISLANSGRPEAALELFMRHASRQDALGHALNCSRVLGDRELEARLMARIEEVRNAQ